MYGFLRTPRRALRRRLALAGAAAATLLLAACGGAGDDASHGARRGDGPSATTTAGAFNDADVAFARQMIPHHQQALDMARLAERRASAPEIGKLAGQIEDAQGPEIATLRSWLKAWGKPASPAAGGSEHGDSGHGNNGRGDSAESEHGAMRHGDGSGASGMMSADEMARLEKAEGRAFDREFARLMIRHHEGAVAMARDEQRSGRHAKAKSLAAAVVTGQSAEVVRLKRFLDGS
ncbi:DUF305 domain-containing protein [Streptomyces sp. NPDC047108]|uniref:DUF305 domain-containing protein n=1 Tax=Streptomyces sp. NPDC047108 TaxID=3155025 RepID=UPI0034036579